MDEIHKHNEKMVKMMTEEKGPSHTPMYIRPSNPFILLFVSLLRVLINLCRRQLQPNVNTTNLKILRLSKWDRFLQQGENCTKPRHTTIANGVSKVMVPGGGVQWQEADK
jgi:hypothetical protein